MARCPHCGESMTDDQEHCYACGQHVRARAYRHERRVNPLVYVGAGLIVVIVLGGLLLIRDNADKKQAVLAAEAETLRVQDSTRRASHNWQEALRMSEKDEEAQRLTGELNNLESRFESTRLRVAANPTPQQESIIGRVEAEFSLLRESVVVLASLAEAERQPMRDSIRAGARQIEDLTGKLVRSQ